MSFGVLVGLFVEGILAFLSPCILPLIPLYVGYLSAKQKEENKSTFLISFCFILGVSAVFFIMGLGVGALKSFITKYQLLISIIGGIVLIIFGLINMGIFKFNLTKEFRLKEVKAKNVYLNAFLLGFFFSFAWTPCVGPYLSNVLILASSTSFMVGNIYILAYALGFMIPFIILGLFTDFTLRLIKKHMNILQITTKLGGLIILMFGCYMIFNAYQQFNVNERPQSAFDQQEANPDLIPSYNFELMDQYDVVHKAEDYLGKPLILQFYASWCKWCKYSMPIMEEYAKTHDINILLVSAPDNPGEISLEEMKYFLHENNINLISLMDVNFEMFNYYGIQSFPTTFFIDENGYVDGYTTGALTEEALDAVFEQIDAEHAERIK